MLPCGRCWMVAWLQDILVGTSALARFVFRGKVSREAHERGRQREARAERLAARRRDLLSPLRRGRPPARRVVLLRDKKRLGVRGSAWLCVSATAAAVRIGLVSRHCSGSRGGCRAFGSRCVRALAFWNCVSGFATRRKRLVQANACSGRPSRVPAFRGGFVRRRALHTMALARPQPGCHFVRWSFGTRLVARVLLPLPVRCVFGSPSCSSPVCCAPRVASGCYAGRSGLSVRRPALLRALRSARLVRFWRRALRPFLLGGPARVRPQP